MQVFHLYFTPALWFLIILTVIDFRLLKMIWALRNHARLVTMEEGQINRANLFFNFKAFSWIILGISFYKFFSIKPWFTIIPCLTILPQNLSVAYRGKHFSIDPNFSYIFLLSRLLIVFYHRLCPYNVQELEPYYIASSIAIGLIFA